VGNLANNSANGLEVVSAVAKRAIHNATVQVQAEAAAGIAGQRGALTVERRATFRGNAPKSGSSGLVSATSVGRKGTFLVTAQAKVNDNMCSYEVLSQQANLSSQYCKVSSVHGLYSALGIFSTKF
jgi:hypothetical protein